MGIKYELKILIEKWIQELHAPLPFGGDLLFGWQEIYIAASESDMDKKHMLRHHLKSRALWNHHTNWELKVETTWNLINQVRREAMSIYKKRPNSFQRRYTEDFLKTAIWQAFKITRGKELIISYNIPSDKIGLSCGAYRIENSVVTENDRSSVKKDHLELVDKIAGLDEMVSLVDIWDDLPTMEKSMQAIATKALKSNDILYQCRFRRHIWK